MKQFRTILCGFNATKDEQENITKVAEFLGLNKSSYMRNLVFKDVEKKLKKNNLKRKG